ncbi:uncharacterized protein PV07_00867 [Cladophialophora immunda]|uniref:Transcription factor domain-containing protein n=1 Tax=Cladophialophora immunda TaxID=569365 RepID=A0A0D2B8Y0_9EURO|nr:uncharacterized protein PV07_00867 [Cladophialophora immunda]KIW34067.1 hypothetical protein PV07_00867 [Cladophialophora immunda]OQV03031.1 Fungal specific transcription factor domain-containing protein [Cladophialophora immunda]
MSPPQRYSFVNARPQTKAEKRQTRTAIRSHIGRWTQENQQKVESTNKSAASAGASSKSSPELSRTDSLSPVESAQSQSQRRSRVKVARPGDTDSSSSASNFDQESTSDDVEDDAGLIVTAPSRLRQGLSPASAGASRPFIHVLGSGVLDPFQTYPSTFPSSLISQCHEYSLQVVWPGLTPRPLSGSESAAIQGWFPMALNDTIALHSLLFGALSHKRLNLLKGSAQPDDPAVVQLEMDMRRCEAESISLINKALRDPNNAITDAVIVSVLALATNAWDLTLQRFQTQPATQPIFDPLLKSLQWLDVYGLLSAHPIHAAGLVQLIALRGGLKNIQTNGLAAIISYSGVIQASRTLTQPVFPFVPLTDDGDRTATLWGMLGTCPNELRDEFTYSSLFDLGLTAGLAVAWVAMQRYEHGVEMFVDGALPDLDLARLCDRRNLIQHTLLSLPSHTDLPSADRPRPIYEPTRLALLIYSLTVIFPLPPQTAPITVLARQLKSALRESDMRSGWSSSHQAQRLLMWILVIGGAAARDVAEERLWFIAALGRLSAQLGIKKFEDLKKNVLKRILWLDRACDAAGKTLWAEILDLGG